MLPVWLVLAATFGATQNDGIRKARTDEIEAVVSQVIEAVKRKDATSIQKYVSEGGIACVDDTIPKRQVADDLKNKDSWLYAYLFDSETFSKKFADPLHPNSL